MISALQCPTKTLVLLYASVYLDDATCHLPSGQREWIANSLPLSTIRECTYQTPPAKRSAAAKTFSSVRACETIF